MEKKERIQIPISLQKKQKLQAISLKLGFDSIIDTVRFLINSILNGSISITVNTKQIEQLNNETEAEVLGSLLEKAKGKTKRFNPSDQDFHNKVIKFADE